MIGRIGIYQIILSIPAHDIRMASADRSIVTNKVIRIAPFLSDTEDRFVQTDLLIALSPDQEWNHLILPRKLPIYQYSSLSDHR